MCLTILLISFCVFFGHSEPQCWNGGSPYNSTWCNCQDIYTNSLPPAGRCDSKSCGYGNVTTKNFCSCEDGWSGPNCEFCKNDDVCKTYFQQKGTVIEDWSKVNCRIPNNMNSLFSYQYMRFSCDVTDALMASYVGHLATFQCDGVGFATDSKPDGATGNCYLQTWGMTKYDGVSDYLGQFVWCDLSDCSAELKWDRTIFYRCEETKCYATRDNFIDNPHRSKQAVDGSWLWHDDILQEISGWSEVLCDRGGTCNFKQKGLSFTSFDMKCTGSECLPRIVPIIFPEKPKVDVLIFVSIGVVVLLGCIFCCVAYYFDCALIWISQCERSRLGDYKEKSGASLEFKNIKYYINVVQDGNCCKATRQILRGISSKVEAGSLCAVMGATGAGKTTLLDILARRNKSGHVSGKIFLNDSEPFFGWTFKRLTGYVVQEDYLMETMTVSEAIMFSADMRLPLTLCDNNKRKLCDGVMKELGIYHIRNSRIGGKTKRGISGGERKRVSVALELVVNPSLLFLDEPTSGLDASTAHEVVSVLKRLTLQKGRTIVMSIHQPRAKIFRLFDTLILLSNGHMVYGGRSSGVVRYFETQHGEKFPGGTENPADWVLDLVCRDERKFEEKRRIVDEERDRRVGNPLVYTAGRQEIEKRRVRDLQKLEKERELLMTGKEKRVVDVTKSNERVSIEQINETNIEIEDVSKRNESFTSSDQEHSQEEENEGEGEDDDDDISNEELEEGGKQKRNLMDKSTEEEEEEDRIRSSSDDDNDSDGETTEEVINIEDPIDFDRQEKKKKSRKKKKKNETFGSMENPLLYHCHIFFKQEKNNGNGRNGGEEHLDDDDENDNGLHLFGHKSDDHHEHDRVCFAAESRFKGIVGLYEDGLGLIISKQNQEEQEHEEQEDYEQQQEEENKNLKKKVIPHYYKNITDIFPVDQLEVNDEGSSDESDDGKKSHRINAYVIQIEWRNTYVISFPSELDEEDFMKQYELSNLLDLRIFDPKSDRKKKKKNRRKGLCFSFRESMGYYLPCLKNPEETEYDDDDESDYDDEKRKKDEEKYIVVDKSEILIYRSSLPLMPYANTFLTQIWYLSVRSFKKFLRNYYLLPMHIGSAILIGILLGMIYYDSNLGISGAQNRLGMIFFMCAVMSFTAMSGLEIFIKERPIFMRERSNNYYYPSIYFFVKICFDLIPLRVIPPLIMGSICYDMVGLNPDIGRFFRFLGLLVLFNVLSGALIILIGTVSTDVAFANIFATLIILLNSVFGGYLVNRDAMPAWISWARYLSYWNYVFENLVINEFDGRQFSLSDDVGLSLELQIEGEGVLDILGMDKDNFGTNTLVSILLAVGFVVASGINIQFFVKERK